MRWITTRRLVRAYRIPWTQAERIVRDECLRAGTRGARTWLLSLIHLTGLFWLLAGAHWVFPTLHGWPLAGTESLGLLMTAPAFFLPRLLARDSMLERAKALAATGDRSEQLTLQ